MGDVPPQVLADLSAGLVETANLMEWLATDMSHLAQVVAAGPVPIGLRMSLSEAAEGMRGRGVTDRLRLVGAAIARGSPEMAGSTFKRLASHRSDVVRQWVCYAVNDPSLFKSLEDRLDHTLQFETQQLVLALRLDPSDVYDALRDARNRGTLARPNGKKTWKKSCEDERRHVRLPAAPTQ
jgi:hypothetical protein